MGSPSPPHVVIFPFMAQGHTIPLLDLSKAFANRAMKVTIIVTPSNAPFIHSKVSNFTNQVSLFTVEFPEVAGLPPGCENTAHLPSNDHFIPFIRATKFLQQPFEDFIKETSPICVISDLFLSWTLDSCRKFRIPRIVFDGMGVLPRTLLKLSSQHYSSIVALPYDQIVRLPDLSLPLTLVRTDFPEQFRLARPDDPFSDLVISEIEPSDVNSWGVIVNSFEELETDYISDLESLYKNEAKAWLVGPLLLQDSEVHGEDQSKPYIKWLDQQMDNSVIYVAFGSQAQLSNNQMDQIALGLQKAGQPFIWVIKSTTWVPSTGWEKRVEDFGVVHRNWVDQRSILAHPSIGGFLSHCGWNSALESLTSGVPLLCWPMGAEQGLNAKYVAMGLKAGNLLPLRYDENGEIRTVDHGVICDGVRELIIGEKGRQVRVRAKEIGKQAKEAVEIGGSSHRKLDQLINCLTHTHHQSKR